MVWLDERLLQADQRCTLAHEIVHIDRGDCGPQPMEVEREIERTIATRLISAEDYYRAAFIHGTDVTALAYELRVNAYLVRARWWTFAAAERKP